MGDTDAGIDECSESCGRFCPRYYEVLRRLDNGSQGEETMAHTAALVEVLKRELKARGGKYADLARPLRLSEASVNRMFSRHDFTLSRLDEICQCAKLDFSDLARALAREETLISQLTAEQEKEIVADK